MMQEQEQQNLGMRCHDEGYCCKSKDCWVDTCKCILSPIRLLIDCVFCPCGGVIDATDYDLDTDTKYVDSTCPLSHECCDIIKYKIKRDISSDNKSVSPIVPVTTTTTANNINSPRGNVKDLFIGSMM